MYALVSAVFTYAIRPTPMYGEVGGAGIGSFLNPFLLFGGDVQVPTNGDYDLTLLLYQTYPLLITGISLFMQRKTIKEKLT